MYDESRIERAKRFSKMWWKSRADSGKSQEFMALGLGVSKKTIQNWEKGLSAPNLFQAAEWFRLLGLNPTKYYMEFLYPQFFEGRNRQHNEAELCEILSHLIKNTSAKEKKELIYLMSGTHGSSWIALLQLLAAHCQTSLQARAVVARTILETYEIEEKTGQLINKAEITPDIDLLKLAISQCKKAAQNGQKGYSIELCEDPQINKEKNKK